MIPVVCRSCCAAAGSTIFKRSLNIQLKGDAQLCSMVFEASPVQSTDYGLLPPHLPLPPSDVVMNCVSKLAQGNCRMSDQLAIVIP